jgi:hypothetical protein
MQFFTTQPIEVKEARLLGALAWDEIYNQNPLEEYKDRASVFSYLTRTTQVAVFDPPPEYVDAFLDWASNNNLKLE